MKIAIVGAGAVGAYHGIKLAQSGNDVHFLLRSDYEIVKERGFELHDCGEVSRVRVHAHKTPQEIGRCDLVVVALKTTANSQFSVLLPPLVGAGTQILTLQNGLGNVEALGALFGSENVLGGLCYVTINRTAPGVICNLGKTLLWIAEGEGAPRERTRVLAEIFRAAGFRTEVQSSLAETLWKKLCWNVPFNGLAIAGGNIDCAQLMASPELVKLSQILMEELQAGARACGIEIPDSHLAKQFDVTRRIGAYLPSSLLDFRAGKPVEVEAIWGEPLRRGTVRGAAMPHLETLYLLLKKLCACRV
ncbi:MAG: 2-dehydropantoate 2-reductase [Opitutae bacterium]|nr:2-dehydropantoate 2-reductase [Opitutae bacterium]